MAVSVSTDWQYNGIGTVVLDNGLLRVVVMPELGAKIWQLTYVPRGRDLLWHHPRIKPRRLPFHAVYDDVFFGGWDELFPNDLAEVIDGEGLPDHGEVWTLPWAYALERVARDEVTLHLWVETPITAVRLEKWITLRAGEAKLRFHHQITSLAATDQPYLWKLHPALAVDAHSRIDMGARSVDVLEFGPTRLGQTGITYEWPYAVGADGQRHDMRRALGSDARVSEFQIATTMDAGWCALTHTRERLGFGLAFDLEVLPSCWLFATYGGWRNLATVVLEPCTGYPLSLAEGVARQTHRVLRAGEVLRTEIVAVVYEGVAAVAGIDADGTVTGADESEA